MRTAYTATGVANARAGQEECAEGALRQALRLDPHHAAALAHLAALYRAQSRTVEAAALLARVPPVEDEGNQPKRPASK